MMRPVLSVVAYVEATFVTQAISGHGLVPSMTIDLYIARDDSRRRANLHDQTNRRTEPSKHIDERIGTEEIDTPAEEIADTRLRHAERLGGSPLFESASRDELLYLDHEVRPDQQMFGLLTAKSHITEHVPGGRCDFQLHGTFPFSYPSRRSTLRQERPVALPAEGWERSRTG